MANMRIASPATTAKKKIVKISVLPIKRPDKSPKVTETKNFISDCCIFEKNSILRRNYCRAGFCFLSAQPQNQINKLNLKLR